MSEPPPDASSREPADLVALARHALRLTAEIERVWSDALDPAGLERAQQGTVEALRALAASIQTESRARNQRVEALGADARLYEWPPSTETVLAWDEQQATDEERWRMLMMSHLRATELLIAALSPLVEASGTETTLSTQERRRWWESGGFALAQSRARLVARIAASMADAEQVLRGEALDPALRYDREVFDAVDSAVVAYRRGDPEASLVHCLRAVRLRVSSLDTEQRVAEIDWTELEPIPGLETLAKLLGRAQERTERLILSDALPSDDGVLLAGALLPHVQRFVMAAPHAQLLALVRAEAAE